MSGRLRAIVESYPYFERLMMSSKKGVRQVIQAPVAAMTLITLTSGFATLTWAIPQSAMVPSRRRATPR